MMSFSRLGRSALGLLGTTAASYIFATAPALAQASGEDAWRQSLWSTAFVILTLIVSGMVALWLIRRRSGFGSNGPMRVVQALHVGPRERIVLVEHDGQQHVIGVTTSQINLLVSVPIDPDGSGQAREHHGRP